MKCRLSTSYHRFMIVAALAALIGLAGCDSGGSSTPSYILITQAEPQEGGTVTGADSGDEYDDGTEVRLTAEPADGFEFGGWEGDVPADAGRSITITMNEDKTVRALFQFDGGGEQPSEGRIPLGGEKVFLSGGNVAWIHFADDIGPGNTDLDQFDDIFQQVEDHGGNAMRLWLHVNGAHTPAWDGSTVTGPGEDAIADLKDILDLAEAHDVGLQLSLWSFDMLARGDYGDTVVDRNYDLLTQPDLTQTYIDNALIPMVEAVGNHPAVIGWEIFNEPEGMTKRYGFGRVKNADRITMSDVQRFINMTAGAIHRTDGDALVTNGAWSFTSLYGGGETTAAATAARHEAPQLPTGAALEKARREISQTHRRRYTTAEARDFLLQAQRTDENYYTNQRLIDAGGDVKGTLDYYTVHYYGPHQGEGASFSPFTHDKSHWNLSKPLAVTEFYNGEDVTDNYLTLYDRGYAGAMAWQWFDYANDQAEGAVQWPRMLDNMQALHDEHAGNVDVSL